MNLYARRRAIENKKDEGLPSGYQQVEYLNNNNFSSGYVELTDIIVGDNEYSIDAEISIPSNTADFFAHGVQSSNYYCVAPYRDIGSRTLTFYPGGVNTRIDFSAGSYHRLVYSVNPATRSISGLFDGNEFSITVNQYTTSNTPFLLFAKNYEGNWHMVGNYIRHRMTVGSERYDLYPCVRLSDNKPGFYDVVHNMFYEGNNVTAGPSV